MHIPKPKIADLQAEFELSSLPNYVAYGGFKIVFKMIGPDGSDQALKLVYLPPAASDDEILFREQLVARATREIEALAECLHPALVKLGTLAPRVITSSGHDYLAYSEEFLPGDSLNAWLIKQPGRPPFSDLFAVFVTLISLIEDLDRLGYLHRDIKPDNIMQTADPERRFVVLDMGIAYKSQATELTRGSAPGTLSYKAPELFDVNYKDNMDFRCDLYSAALTVYALSIGSNPFRPGPQSMDVTEYRVRNTTPEPLSKHRPDLPPQFCKIIDRCIRKKPALRYASLSLLNRDLEKLRP